MAEDQAPAGGRLTAVERRAQRGAAVRARQRRRRVQLAVGAGALLVLLAVLAGILVRRESDPWRLRTFSGLARDHVTTTVTYPQTPPVGGPHSAVWQNCGYYSAPVKNENAVHDLEHGAVWITYRPDLPAEAVAALRARAHAQPFILVSPYPGLPAPVVASAWGAQRWLTGVDDPHLDEFLRTYRASPNAPEPGSPCTGGTGTPE